jgi:hypothetical protein
MDLQIFSAHALMGYYDFFQPLPPATVVRNPGFALQLAGHAVSAHLYLRLNCDLNIHLHKTTSQRMRHAQGRTRKVRVRLVGADLLWRQGSGILSY